MNRFLDGSKQTESVDSFIWNQRKHELMKCTKINRKLQFQYQLDPKFFFSCARIFFQINHKHTSLVRRYPRGHSVIWCKGKWFYFSLSSPFGSHREGNPISLKDISACVQLIRLICLWHLHHLGEGSFIKTDAF